MLSCSSDADSDPIVECPLGYAGVNCETELVPSKIWVTSIRVTSFPNTNGGFPWDVSDNPDIFVRLGRGNGDENTILLWSSEVATNAASGNPYQFVPTSPVEVAVGTQNVVILGDYDSSSSHEFMGGYTFFNYEPGDGFPATRVLTSGGSSLAFEVKLAYGW